jgi:hypothetical protein
MLKIVKVLFVTLIISLAVVGLKNIAIQQENNPLSVLIFTK